MSVIKLLLAFGVIANAACEGLQKTVANEVDGGEAEVVQCRGNIEEELIECDLVDENCGCFKCIP